MKVYGLLGLLLVACTKPNPAACCLDEADCAANGFKEVRMCAAGLACVDHQCVVPSCSMTGCAAEAPVCNITTDVCEGCTESNQCSRFSDTDVCDTATGACVECVTAADCDAAEPVCDASRCRACKLDSECSSGACGDDGACVPESAIVYMDPGGTDFGMCSRTAPCRTLAYAISQTSLVRSHIVLAPGGYVGAVTIGPQDTPANPLYIHGGGASHSFAPQEEATLLDVRVPARIRDLELVAIGGNALSLTADEPSYVERIRIRRAYLGVSTSGTVTLRDVEIADATYGISFSGQITVERAVIYGGQTGIAATNGVMNVSNALIYGTTRRALELQYASGSISFSTIADSGTDSGDGPRAVACGGQLTIRSSIIWAPGLTERVPVEGCNLSSTIAGPTITPGAMNANPQFVDAANGDYHLAANSPARDVVDSGPETDFEGDPRPRGARFDIGADEAE